MILKCAFCKAAARKNYGFDTHSLRKLNALRHTCQLKFQTG